ncbi:DnaJ domain-containing protein [bacterium]|nr:DnaJ domain-containing protein [bacterium]
MQILYVSSSDLIRAPMARVLSMKLAAEMNAIGSSFESAGLDVENAAPPPLPVIQFLRSNRLNISKHRSKPVDSPILRRTDLIVCMTHDLAKRARSVVGAEHEGKIVILNEAVGFGRTPREKDIQEPEILEYGPLLSLYSQLKASVGRLCRILSEADVTPADFGAVETDTMPEHFLDDPHLRHFLAHYIHEFIERAFEPPAVKQIQEALEAMGRPLSRLDVEELLRTDLRGQVKRTHDGCWEIDATAAREKEEQARKEREQKKAEEARRAREKAEREKAAQEQANMSIDEALDILSVTMQTPREQAQNTYRKLLMRYHPDKFHDDEDFRKMAESKTKRVNIAWGMLKDRLPAG